MLAPATRSADRPAPQLNILLFVCAWCVLLGVACSGRPLKADPALLAVLPPELLGRLRADPFNYFRFVNHEWTERACNVFAPELPRQPIVQLHGDAHVEQYAFTADGWGLDDFDDATRGPALVDIVRFLGSINLAAERRGWARERDRLYDRFFSGYRQGLNNTSYQPSEPDIVRAMRAQHPPPTRAEFLQWAESKMIPMSEETLAELNASMGVFGRIVQHERPGLSPDYFQVLRAGWLRMGIGSAVTPKILMRVRGPSDDPGDDDVLEAKTIRSLQGLGCLESPTVRPTFRIVVGSQQIGRLRHRILVAGPDVDLSNTGIDLQHIRNWWIRSWEPSYREITLDDLPSVEDLSDIVYDSAVQLSAGSIHGNSAREAKLRTESLAAIVALEPRLRKSADSLVAEMMQGWRELGRR
jgi:hypothetical protein